MFFRWPSDGAATLLGPSGRPLATSPAVQGAARDYGGGGAQTAAQGRKGCRRAERAGNQHHARLARYMDRAARWLQHTGNSHDARSFAPKRTPLAAPRWERRAARRATGSGHDVGEWLHGKRQRVHTAVQNETGHHLRRRSVARGRQLRRTAATATAGPHPNTTGAPKAAASSAGSRNTQRKPAPLAPAHVAATGGRSTESGGRQRGGAETAPRHHTATGGGVAAATPHRGRQLQRTATAAEPGERRRRPPRQRRAHSGNGGFPKRHTAARRAAHGGPDRQRRHQQSRAPRPGPATEATDCWRLSRPNSLL